MGFKILEWAGIDGKGVTSFYGESATGKTTFSLACASEALKNGQKVVYVDTQHNFSPERLMQICNCDKKMLENAIVVSPKDFSDQQHFLERLRNGINKTVGLIIIDPISTFYRLEFAKKDSKPYMISRNLGVQMSYLNDMARKHSIPVIVTAEALSDVDANQETTMSGGNIIDHMCKNVIELKRYDDALKLAILKKPKPKKEIFFSIVNEGISIMPEDMGKKAPNINARS